MRNRRQFLLDLPRGAAVLGAGSLLPGPRRRRRQDFAGAGGAPLGTLESSVLEALPGKVPLIKRTWRPPNFETPVSYFNEAFTPNDAFFVRYHLATIPEVAPQEWRLEVWAAMGWTNPSS